MTKLVAFAGQSRSGKGTCARVFAEECEARGLTSLERQLSDNGKWAAARIFRPTIGRADAVAWFEELKNLGYDRVSVRLYAPVGESETHTSVSLREFLQHSLQEGGRDIFGEHLWTNMIIPITSGWNEVIWWSGPQWLNGFFDVESRSKPTDLAIISDLRQPNEAERVKCKYVDGIVVEVVRPDNETTSQPGADHITEKQLPRDLVDHVIVNDGTLEELEDKARLLFYNHVETWIRKEQSHGVSR